MFTKNLGQIDQILRIIIEVILLSLTIIEPKTPWGYIGLILILTAFINFARFIVY